MVRGQVGGFIDASSNNLPDQQGEWDKDGDSKHDSYFLVTNAGKLKQQLSETFEEIISRTSSAAVAVNSARWSKGVGLQARFNSGVWNGELRALSVNPITRRFKPTQPRAIRWKYGELKMHWATNATRTAKF
ncbi:MAG: hypothetical protein MZW92_54980 [Comamonadaceae bacterium]|nr:hypothetical protein [Comamonadaceae bacterium]